MSSRVHSEDAPTTAAAAEEDSDNDDSSSSSSSSTSPLLLDQAAERAAYDREKPAPHFRPKGKKPATTEEPIEDAEETDEDESDNDVDDETDMGWETARAILEASDALVHQQQQQQAEEPEEVPQRQLPRKSNFAAPSSPPQKGVRKYTLPHRDGPDGWPVGFRAAREELLRRIEIKQGQHMQMKQMQRATYDFFEELKRISVGILALSVFVVIIAVTDLSGWLITSVFFMDLHALVPLLLGKLARLPRGTDLFLELSTLTFTVLGCMILALRFIPGLGFAATWNCLLANVLFALVVAFQFYQWTVAINLRHKKVRMRGICAERLQADENGKITGGILL
jgi:hypothetical protein